MILCRERKGVETSLRRIEMCRVGVIDGKAKKGKGVRKSEEVVDRVLTGRESGGSTV